MAIPQSTLRTYASREGFQKSASVVNEAKQMGRQTAFMSHSHRDADLAKGVQGFLQSLGWEVYIDWEDTVMPDKPDRRTATRIQQRIIELDWFFFLATENSMRSRWCPWEIGYADGKKPLDSILILQTKDESGHYYGNEYLQLYRYISASQSGAYRAYGAAQTQNGVLMESMRR
ncbi:TIR domain-containing protein [Haloferula rosea]|uniref:Toll/interleukin-1 receptor domain-containing protein n=1 Tax=Haloferula rosea TaxID=490093 RepID=A0A934RD76_9BACT|nr:toll/interleukin-1 receptor domain-containing protein [Haloferula rosea]